jgi:hypothetical protein
MWCEPQEQPSSGIDKLSYLLGVRRDVGKRSMVNLKPISCPVCVAEGQDITAATFDGSTIRCDFCGDYDVSGTVFNAGLLDKLDRQRRLDALERAKCSTPSGKRLMITSHDL